jgi:aldose 1-epimerase
VKSGGREAVVIKLGDGELSMSLVPHAGGGILSFTAFGRDIFRRADCVEEVDPVDLSCFPMTPYANRIAQGRFRLREEFIEIRSSWARHALHGFGWRRPWNVDRRTSNSAMLSYQEDRGSWPWRYRTELSVVLEENTAFMELAVENLDDRPMPASLGFHPFFLGIDEAELDIQADGVWLTDEELIPTKWAPIEAAPVSFAPARPIAGTNLDNCFTGFRGTARIIWPRRRIEVVIEAPACRFLQVYSQAADGSFCVEAQTAMPDAFNHSEEVSGARSIEPGGRFTCLTGFRVSEL